MNTDDVLICEDFADAGTWSLSQCCDSCHDDNRDAGYEMCWKELGPIRAHVCCRLWEQLDADSMQQVADTVGMNMGADDVHL